MWLVDEHNIEPEPTLTTDAPKPEGKTGEANSDNASDQIAVVGMSTRLPGGIKKTEVFWDPLVNGKDCHGSVPRSRYNAESF